MAPEDAGAGTTSRAVQVVARGQPIVLAVLRQEANERDDKPTIENPFYFLAGDKFWRVTPHGEKERLYHLIAPCPDSKRRARIWRVNDQQLDDRIEEQREFVELSGKAVIPPSEEKFYSAIESLRCREEHLTAAY